MKKNDCGLCLSQPGEFQKLQCKFRHKICDDCWKFGKKTDYKINCFECLNICNKVEYRCCFCDNIQDLNVLLCPNHWYCKCIKQFKYSQRINCEICKALHKDLCIGCFEFTNPNKNIHDNHYLCKSCFIDLKVKNIGNDCFECRQSLSCDDQNLQISSEKKGISEKNSKIEYMKNYGMIHDARFEIEIAKKCLICHKYNQYKKNNTWQCSKGDYPCKNCLTYNFDLNEKKLPCFYCLNNCCVYKANFGCKFCSSTESYFQLCDLHLYCKCLLSKLDKIDCPKCLKILKYFCYNCGVLKNCNKIHNNHNLCHDCEILIKNKKRLHSI